MAKKPKPLKAPPTAKPWDILPIESKGDDSPEGIYHAVGGALFLWERLEERQARLFAVLVNSRAGAAEDAYGIVQSPSSRSAMIGAAARAVFEPNDPLLLELRTLLNDIGQLAGRRNDIAHGLTLRFRSVHVKVGKTEADEDEVTETPHGYYLTSSSTNTRKRIAQDEVAERRQSGAQGAALYQKYAYTTRQIRAYGDHFSVYEDLVEDLTKRVKAHCDVIWPPPPKSLSPATLHANRRVRQMPSELPPPPPPSPASPRKRAKPKRD